MHAFRQRSTLVLVASLHIVSGSARWTPVQEATNVLDARSTASEVVHDKFFIPAVASMGVLALFALLCVFMIARKSSRTDGEGPRALSWAPPAPGPDGELPNTYPPHGIQRDIHNDDGSPKDGGKPLPAYPLLASPTGAPPLAPGMARPFGTDQGAYYPPHQARLVAVPAPAPVHAPPPNVQASPPGPPHSPLSSGQSSTQVGSDGEPVKTKPYSAVGGYGFSTLPRGQEQGQLSEVGAQHGAERSQASTFGSNYNPYDGIDTTYREGEGQASGGEREAPAYTDPNNSGGQYYNAQKHAA